MTVIQYHATPSPHIVCDQATFDDLKRHKPSDISTDALTGHLPAWLGTPVYIGACPTLWKCPPLDAEATR